MVRPHVHCYIPLFRLSCGAFQFSLEGSGGDGTGFDAEIPLLASKRGGLLRNSDKNWNFRPKKVFFSTIFFSQQKSWKISKIFEKSSNFRKSQNAKIREFSPKNIFWRQKKNVFRRKFLFLSEFLNRPPRLDANNGISKLKPVPAPPEPSALNWNAPQLIRNSGIHQRYGHQ